MKKLIMRCWAAVLMSAVACSNLYAEDTDTETFSVNVEPVLVVTAPTPSVSIIHDETDNDQLFAPQQWTVQQNNASGATVTFATDQPFTNAGDANYQRDAKLDLALASSDDGSGWSVGVPSDQTDYANETPKLVATVEASSTAAGDAAFDLTVTYLTDIFSTLAAGNYTTTVTGTITAN